MLTHIPKVIVLLLVSLLPVAAFAQRQTVDLGEGWKFVRHDAAPDAPVAADWQGVSVPHCWNALDGQDGKAADPGFKDGYYRGPAWYARTLDIPAAWQQRRVFIRFEAAFLVADVYLNGHLLGQHRGGFAAFCYELTPHLKFGGPNELRVRLDNSVNPEVAPLSADFTMEGGIYRPVHLLVTDRTCITPLDFAGPGVYATATGVSAESARLEVETRLDGPTGPDVQVAAEIRDAQGKTVLRQDSPASNASVKQDFTLPRPHLWNGRKDPYVYSVNVKLRRAGQVIDEVTQPLGFRTMEITADKGFLLNGETYPIYGVNRHQEKRDKGWALTPDDHAEDLRLILELGATAVRLAHYQQSEVVHDLADHDGLLLWQEIPLVNKVADGPAFADNATQQLTEMIRQGYNHPSIMTWSLFNELYNDKNGGAAEPLIAALLKSAQALDSTRTISSASDQPRKVELDRITPWIAFNLYPGWYTGTTEDMEKDIQTDFNAAGGNRRIALSEYGAGSSPAQHQEGAPVKPLHRGPFHPEEYQAFVHERDWKHLRGNPHLWGTFLWVMFDFASDGRNEGASSGVNDKGLVTEDRKIKKDAYYFYKANWNPEPMVYLTARRMTPRKQAVTEVKVYTNCAQAELRLNGQSVGVAKPDETHICLWPNVTLRPGSNQVEVSAQGPDGKPLSDRCEWTLEEAPPSPTASPSP